MFLGGRRDAARLVLMALTMVGAPTFGCATTRIPPRSVEVPVAKAHTGEETAAIGQTWRAPARVVILPLTTANMGGKGRVGAARARAQRGGRGGAQQDLAARELREVLPERSVLVLMPADPAPRKIGGRDLAQDALSLAGAHMAAGGRVLQVDPDPGSLQLERLDLGESTNEAALTLLVVGAGYWDIHGELGRAPKPARPRAELERLDVELARLRSDLRASPRDVVLIAHMPIEATGAHGMGGLVNDATLRHAPAPLRDAILDGVFVGAIGGHEPELAIQLDASDAIRRSTKLDVPDRLFLVQAGASSPRTRMDPRRSLARNRGLVLDPELVTKAAGLIVLDLQATTWRATVHVRRGGRWRASVLGASLHDRWTGGTSGDAPARAWPTNMPCPTCDPRLTPARPQ